MKHETLDYFEVKQLQNEYEAELHNAIMFRALLFIAIIAFILLGGYMVNHFNDLVLCAESSFNCVTTKGIKQ